MVRLDARLCVLGCSDGVSMNSDRLNDGWVGQMYSTISSSSYLERSGIHSLKSVANNMLQTGGLSWYVDDRWLTFRLSHGMWTRTKLACVGRAQKN